MQRFLSLTIFLVIMGCGHLSRRDTRWDPELLPPTTEARLKNPEAPNVRWFTLFEKSEMALNGLDKSAACSGFRSLAQETRFPLKDLALMRAHEICPDSQDLPALETLSESSRQWFQEAWIRSRRVHFDTLGENEKVHLLWQQAKLEKDDRKREALLVDAVGFAEKGANADLKKEAQNVLWKNSPRLKPDPTPADEPAIAQDYRRQRDFDRSLQIEKKRLKRKDLSDEERFSLLKSIRQTYKVAQRKAEMLQATADLRNFAKEGLRKQRKSQAAAKRRLESDVTFARAFWTENQRDLAWKSLNEARRDLSGLVSLEEVYFVMGRMEEEKGDLASAEGYLEKAATETSITPGLKEKILWSKSWLLYKLEDKAKAAASFAELNAAAKDPGDQIRAQYWQARSLSDTSAREKLLRQVRELDPLGYYGLLTYRDLQEPIPPLAGTEGKTDLSMLRSSEFPATIALTTEWLIALNLKDGVVRLLDQMQSDFRKNNPSHDAWLRLASTYARAGEYLPLFGLMGTLAPELRNQLTLEKPELLFAQPSPESVQRASSESGMPVARIYAIMRQESAFNPRARSGAEAYGLMQLLPSIASQHARKIGMKFDGAQDLFIPDVSIRLGAHELKTLFTRWKNLWIPAVASYNANAEAVRGWLQTRKRDDPTEFIEEIPYDETRAYVKLVMRNEIFYRRSQSDRSFVFPEELLTFSN